MLLCDNGIGKDVYESMYDDIYNSIDIYFFRLDMVNIRGKRGRKVPLILTSEIVKSMNALIKYRSMVGVKRENKYVFAAPTRDSLRHLRGHDCLAAVVNKVGLVNPAAVKSTKLRKYIATVSQIVDLNENEMEWLARHMGHDLSVHKDFYRLHDHTIELSKVSRLLLAVDEGKASKWAGKKLQDITVDGKYDLFSFLSIFKCPYHFCIDNFVSENNWETEVLPLPVFILNSQLE